MHAHARGYSGCVPSEAERAWEAILRAYVKLEPRLDEELKHATGLALSSYRALHELNSGPAETTMSELALRIGLSRTRISRLVDELERAGLVHRRVSPSDKRASFVSTSPDGRRRLSGAADAYQAIVGRNVTSLLDKEQIHQISAALDSILRAER